MLWLQLVHTSAADAVRYLYHMGRGVCRLAVAGSLRTSTDHGCRGDTCRADTQRRDRYYSIRTCPARIFRTLLCSVFCVIEMTHCLWWFTPFSNGGACAGEA